MLLLKCHLECKHDVDFMIVDISKQSSEPYLWRLILPASQTEIKRKYGNYIVQTQHACLRKLRCRFMYIFKCPCAIMILGAFKMNKF